MNCLVAAQKTETPPEGGVSVLKLARPAGFEPTTPWFVAKYSIQLSYGRNGNNYNQTARFLPLSR
jgi:hypothetical protein